MNYWMRISDRSESLLGNDARSLFLAIKLISFPKGDRSSVLIEGSDRLPADAGFLLYCHNIPQLLAAIALHNSVTKRQSTIPSDFYLSRSYALGRDSVILSGKESLKCFTTFSMTFNCISPAILTPSSITFDIIATY